MPRLDHLLARALGCPRGHVQRLLAAGGVTDEAGKPLTDPRAPIDAASLPLTVIADGTPLALHEHVHLALNKPVGVVTALRDDRHPTAYELLREAPLFGELRAVGRLDLDTSGLLLWTTDGTLLQRLTHPKRAVPRTYQAALARPFAPPPDRLVLEDGHVAAIAELVVLPDPALLHPSLRPAVDATTFASITLTGGAYHEVRRIFAALGSHVLSLCRNRFGKLDLPGETKPGAWFPLAPGDVI